MKDYTFEEEDKSQYIINIHDNLDKTFDVYFADGSWFRGIEATPDNYRKVKTILEEQAKVAVENYPTYKKEARKAEGKVALSLIGISSLEVIVANVPKVKTIIEKEPPLVVFCGFGAITILGTIPSIVKMIKKKKKVKELDKIIYRNQHKRELQSIRNYPNASSGSRYSFKHMIQRESDPFSMIHIDEYSIDDLENVVSNIQKEESYQFTYKKKKVRNRT